MTKIDMNITHLKCNWNIPGSDELMFCCSLVIDDRDQNIKDVGD